MADVKRWPLGGSIKEDDQKENRIHHHVNPPLKHHKIDESQGEQLTDSFSNCISYRQSKVR